MGAIVYGWGNYAARNISYTRSYCDQCGKLGYLKSYDAWRFGSLYWIPLLPLGGRHVINECPACRMGRHVGARQWRAFRGDGFQSAMEAHSREPRNAKAANDALAAVVACADHVSFQEVALRIEKHLSKDPAVLLQLGRAYAYFRMDEEALGAMLASVQAKPTEDAHTATAAQLMEMGRLEEAAAHVAEAVALGGEAKAPLMLLLAEAHQALGQHREALGVLDELKAEFPAALPKESAYQRSLSQDRKEGRRVPARSLTLGAKPPKDRPFALRAAPLAVGPVLALAGLVAFVMACWNAAPKHVYVVGGLSRPYQVLINGKPEQVPAMGARRIAVGWGALTIEPAPGSVAIEPASATVSVPFWSRLGDQPLLAINPDRAAVVHWQNLEYHLDASRARDEHKLYAGEPTYWLDPIDYPWQMMPESVSLSSNNPSVWRTGVEVLNEPPLATYIVLKGNGEPGALEAYFREVLRLEPERPGVIDLVSVALGPEAALEALGPALAVRPLIINAHRAYQSISEREGPSPALVEHYRELLDAEPDNGDLMYLLARVTTDEAEKRSLLERSVSALRPSAWGHHGLAFAGLSRGAFAEGLDHARAARELLPNEASVRSAFDELLAANGQWGELIVAARSEFEGDPHTTYGAAELVRYLAQSDRPEDARPVIEEAVRRAGEQASPDESAAEMAEVRKFLNLAEAEGRGDVEAVAAALEAEGSSRSRFYAALLKGDFAGASAAFDGGEDEGVLGPYDRLLLYAATVRGGADGDAALRAAIEVLKEGGADARRLADWLSAGVAPTLEEVARQTWMPKERLVALTALGVRFESGRSAFFEAARRFNYDRVTPHLLIDRLTSEAGTAR